METNTCQIEWSRKELSIIHLPDRAMQCCQDHVKEILIWLFNIGADIQKMPYHRWTGKYQIISLIVCLIIWCSRKVRSTPMKIPLPIKLYFTYNSNFTCNSNFICNSNFTRKSNFMCNSKRNKLNDTTVLNCLSYVLVICFWMCLLTQGKQKQK